MQIVIDIDDKSYERILKHYNTFPRDISSYEKQIIDGTPLPKGHGRLIDADILVDGFEDNYEFCEAVNATPTIIPATKEDTIGKFVDALFFGESTTKEGDVE